MAGEFKQPINVPVGGKVYQLVEDYTYEWSVTAKGETSHFRITVPAGFMYDGASVPRIAWTLTGILPDGPIRAAALVHDWIYEHKGKLPAGSHQYRDAQGQWQDVIAFWKRKPADRLFGRLMREADISSVKRRLAYSAVRAFGGFYWNR